VTGDRYGEDWAEREAPRRSGRHSRAPQYGDPEPYAGADQYPPPDPYAADGSADPASYPGAGQYGQPDPYAPPERLANTDPYATRPPRLPADPYAPPGPSYGLPDAGRTEPHDQPGYARDGLYDRGRGGPDAYDPLTAPRGPNGYGPADPLDPTAGGRGQNGYGPPSAQGNGDDGPFRWRPSPESAEPQSLAPLPDYGRSAARPPDPTRQPEPEPRDWDQSQQHDWDQQAWDQSQQHDWNPGGADSGVQLGEPVSGPVQRTPWRDEPAQAEDWDNGPPSREGLIPGFGASRDSRDTGRARGGRPKRRVGRVLAPLLALVLLVALGAGGYKIYRHFQSPDFTGPGTGEVTVQVLNGDTATSLAPRLVKAGVVASTSSFISAAKDSSNPDGLEPGFFRLRRHMNSAAAYAMLLNPKARIQSVVTIPEGLRATNIIATLETKTGVSASAFAAAEKDTSALGLPSYANGNVEGYLFPATYNFNPGTSALSMLKTMVAQFNQEASSINLPAAAKTAQLTPNQVITVASILEAEAGNPKYYADVAEVIYNRLNQDMFLGLDSTVNYALHRFGVSLTQSQLQVNSPYNTFIHKGLPPGPIDSPGNAAIVAALHPAHGDLLYFVTVNVKTGLTKFATTSAGFQQLENECDQNNSC
jgi:peptidoglycan lytic transglycosylase G